MVRVSAPGKLMLLGEHAVLYNQPCLVAAISQRLFLEAEKIPKKEILISAPEMGIFNFKIPLKGIEKVKERKLEFILRAIKNFFTEYKIQSGLRIKTKSRFSPEHGLGSSSAVTVCTISALAKLFKIEIEKKEIFNLSYKTILDIQGVGSGFDIASAIYGGVIYFLTGGEIIEPLKVKDLPLIVGYTGVKIQTGEILEKVKPEIERAPQYYQLLFDQIGQLVEKAKEALEKSDWKRVGKLMLENQEILRRFRVPSKKYGLSSEIIEKLIRACQRAGAFGAKLSGAGVGDCVIALGENKKRIQKAIKLAGGIPLSVEVDDQGLRIEEL